ncbi:hypothetical protein CTAYLR_009953 [Chrysophaeum taylorii]|uniref:Secreted protein n=1 Tax=Chrysophaeum taylorii TaxID=2483200 RepID=A0AAD7UIP6_9STRA|nr:hypothetical protein CTAYLR_009953 [Chrysophaeum taylorii]
MYCCCVWVALVGSLRVAASAPLPTMPSTPRATKPSRVECPCFEEPARWGSKATTALAGVGAAVKLWKVLPRDWRTSILTVTSTFIPTAVILPLLRYPRLLEWLTMLQTIGRTLLFGVVDAF